MLKALTFAFDPERTSQRIERLLSPMQFPSSSANTLRHAPFNRGEAWCVRQQAAHHHTERRHEHLYFAKES
jgi:hypothetical protein